MVVSSKFLATKRIYFTPLKRESFLFFPSWISMTLKEAKIHKDRMCLKEVLDIILHSLIVFTYEVKLYNRVFENNFCFVESLDIVDYYNKVTKGTPART